MAKSKAKRLQAYQAMIDNAVENAEKHYSDPARHKRWREQYARSLKSNSIKPSTPNVSNWTVCAKKEIDDSRWKRHNLSSEMIEREKLAQEEIDNKRMRVAPLYNKGGLQYVGNNAELKFTNPKRTPD